MRNHIGIEMTPGPRIDLHHQSARRLDSGGIVGGRLIALDDKKFPRRCEIADGAFQKRRFTRARPAHEIDGQNLASRQPGAIARGARIVLGENARFEIDDRAVRVRLRVRVRRGVTLVRRMGVTRAIGVGVLVVMPMIMAVVVDMMRSVGMYVIVIVSVSLIVGMVMRVVVAVLMIMGVVAMGVSVTYMGTIGRDRLVVMPMVIAKRGFHPRLEVQNRRFGLTAAPTGHTHRAASSLSVNMIQPKTGFHPAFARTGFFGTLL